MHLIENPKLANIGFDLLTFYELLGHNSALMQNSYPSFHFHMKPKQRFYVFWIEQKEKKNLFEAHSSLALWKNFPCTLWTPIIDAHWLNKILIEFPEKAYFSILIWFSLWIPNCAKKCNPSQSCSKILTKFDLGQYPFLRVRVSIREHYYLGSTWQPHGIVFLVETQDSLSSSHCVSHFLIKSSYGGDQTKKLPSQSKKVAIVKTSLSTYLISPFLSCVIGKTWYCRTHTHERRRGHQLLLLPCDFFCSMQIV
jgi:hypothetical protein